MLVVHLNKIVTFSKELKDGWVKMWDCKYKDIEGQLVSVNEIEVNYCYGQEKRRVKLLESLGYKLKETKWRNTEELHSSIKQIWVR